jgi:type IV secretory pathway TrbD component
VTSARRTKMKSEKAVEIVMAAGVTAMVIIFVVSMYITVHFVVKYW